MNGQVERRSSYRYTSDRLALLKHKIRNGKSLLLASSPPSTNTYRKHRASPFSATAGSILNESKSVTKRHSSSFNKNHQHQNINHQHQNINHQRHNINNQRHDINNQRHDINNQRHNINNQRHNNNNNNNINNHKIRSSTYNKGHSNNVNSNYKRNNNVEHNDFNNNNSVNHSNNDNNPFYNTAPSSLSTGSNSMNMFRTSPPMNDENTVQQPQENEPLIKCPTCDRSFNQRALKIHIKICKKVFQKKRKQFDTAKKRGLVKTRRGVGRRNKRSTKERSINKPKTKSWKAQSALLRQAMAAARGDSKRSDNTELGQQPFLGSLPPEVDDRVPCPHCNRRFNAQVAERHIPHCANTRARPGRLPARNNNNNSNNRTKPIGRRKKNTRRRRQY